MFGDSELADAMPSYVRTLLESGEIDRMRTYFQTADYLGPSQSLPHATDIAAVARNLESFRKTVSAVQDAARNVGSFRKTVSAVQEIQQLISASDRRRPKDVPQRYYPAAELTAAGAACVALRALYDDVRRLQLDSKRAPG